MSWNILRQQPSVCLLERESRWTWCVLVLCRMGDMGSSHTSEPPAWWTLPAAISVQGSAGFKAPPILWPCAHSFLCSSGGSGSTCTRVALPPKMLWAADFSGYAVKLLHLKCVIRVPLPWDSLWNFNAEGNKGCLATKSWMIYAPRRDSEKK